MSATAYPTLPARLLPAQPLCEIDPQLLPASVWIAAFEKLIDETGNGRNVTIDLLRGEGIGYRTTLRLLPDAPEHRALNAFRLERLVKTLLWMVGGYDIRIDGAAELVPLLAETYSAKGERAFDNEIIGQKVYGRDLVFTAAALAGTPAPSLQTDALGGHLQGNRIGFDLGGSDRKCAALIEGEVVFSEEIPWNPYFEADPQYHIDGIRDSLQRAAAHLPHVDAIGGSAAGIYVNNEPRIASLFRGVSDADFKAHVSPIFANLRAEWGNVPFAVANDGDVTALAGAAMLKDNAVLGISMGTSLAVGYVDPQGRITGWLNELAFSPVDFREGGPLDEWSGDAGCGVQYFSQQGVQRLSALAGFNFDASLPAPELLVRVQEKMKEGDQRALRLFTAIGTALGYTLALYSEFYSIRHLLLLGRVLSGEGGNTILRVAGEVLKKHFPQLQIELTTPDEAFKRHGQAVAAASLSAAN